MLAVFDGGESSIGSGSSTESGGCVFSMNTRSNKPRSNTNSSRIVVF